MGKYILKRLGYMVVVFFVLSLLMYLVYAMIPFSRATAEAEKFKPSYKDDPAGFEQFKQDKIIELGENRNVFLRYLGWLGVAPKKDLGV